MTKRNLPAHIYDKKGVLYFQRRGYKTTRIKADAGTPAFALEYAALLNGATVAPEGKDRTIKALVAEYVRSKKYRDLAPRTARDYDKVLAWIVQKMGSIDVAVIRQKDIVRTQDAQAGKLRFANYIVQVLRVVLSYGVRIGWLTENPAKGIAMLETKAEKRQPWPPAVIDRYRAAATGRALLIFELCLGTAQRIGDVLAMRWGDIDGDGLLVRQSKTGAALWVPITPRLQAVLDATPRIGDTICAHGKDGRPLKYSAASQAVRDVRDAIGARAYDIHGLRYSATAELAEAGCSDELIASITGHKTTLMIAKYAGPARQRARAKEAQRMRGTNQDRLENVANDVEKANDSDSPEV